MTKKMILLSLVAILICLPLFSQKTKVIRKNNGFSKTKLSIKTVNLDKNSKKNEKPIPKKNYDKYEYDEAGRITKVISKDKGEIKYVFNEYGKLERKIKANIETEHYFYDLLGRETKFEYKSKGEKDIVEFKYSTTEESYMPGNLVEKIEKSEHSFYKYHGRILKEEKKIIRGHEFVVKYNYNEKGLLSDIHYPSGLMVSYMYDNKNKIENVFVTKDNKKNNIIKYIRKQDSTTSFQYGNGLTTSFAKNTENRTIQMKTGDVQDLIFFFNQKGNINKVVDNKNSRNKKEFYYDKEDRLITAYGPWGKISYRYDPMDNLTTKIEKDCKMELSYNKKSSRIEELKENGEKVEVKYDKLGRMTQYGDTSFTYNIRGRLENILKNNKAQVEMFYNYKNQRVIEKIDNKEFYYIYDNQDRVLAQHENKGNVLKEYIYSKEIPVGFIKDNKTYCYHYDLMNFPILISDESGKIVRKVQYRPYGEIISSDGNFKDSLRFPGQYKIEETDLYYNLNRTYNSEIGRYIEPDPVMNDENLYQYALANPLMFYDKTGLSCDGNKKKTFLYSSRNYGKPLTLSIKFEPSGFKMKLTGTVETNWYCKKNNMYMFLYKVYVVLKSPLAAYDYLTKIGKKLLDKIKKMLVKTGTIECKWEVVFKSKKAKYTCPTWEEFTGQVVITVDWYSEELSGKVGNLIIKGNMVERPKLFEKIKKLFGDHTFEFNSSKGWGLLRWLNMKTSGTEENAGIECNKK